MSRALAILVVSAALLAVVPTAEAGQPCTTMPRHPVERVVWAAACALEGAPDPSELEPEFAVTVIDLRSLNACPGPWGHDEYTQVGPVVIVTYECDDGDV